MSDTEAQRRFAPSHLRRRWLRFCRDRRAVSAVEFALLLPLMLTLYIGGTEVGQAISIYRKVGRTAYVLGDLVAQVSSLNATDMSNVLDASTAVMSPYAASGANMIVSGVNYDGTKMTVAWSSARNTTPWTVNAAPPSTVTIPNTILTAGQQIVVSYVSYSYSTGFSNIMKDMWGSDTIVLSDVVFLRPRLSSSITCTGC